jgi:hypothetical protein
MMPIQRITRYWLLLERLKSYVERNSIVYESLGVAEGYMKEIGNVLQGIQRQEEEMRKVVEILERVENCPATLVSFSQRRFVAEFYCVDVTMNGLQYIGFGLQDIIEPGSGSGGSNPQRSNSGSGTNNLSKVGVLVHEAFFLSGSPSASSASSLSPALNSGSSAMHLTNQRTLFIFSDCILVAANKVSSLATSRSKNLPARNSNNNNTNGNTNGNNGNTKNKLELVQKFDLINVAVLDMPPTTSTGRGGKEVESK